MSTRVPPRRHAVPPSDLLGRPLKSLRISVTDRCNMRCRYCMPEQEYVWLPRDSILSFEEIDRLVGIFAGLGVYKGPPHRGRAPAAARPSLAGLDVAPAPAGGHGADDKRGFCSDGIRPNCAPPAWICAPAEPGHRKSRTVCRRSPGVPETPKACSRGIGDARARVRVSSTSWRSGGQRRRAGTWGSKWPANRRPEDGTSSTWTWGCEPTGPSSRS